MPIFAHYDTNTLPYACVVLAVDVDTTLPNVCCHCAFNTWAVRKWFLHAVKTMNLSRAGVEQVKEAVQNGVRPCWSPFHATDGIFYSSLAAMNIGSYPMLWKAIFIQCDDLGSFFGRRIRSCTHDKMMVCTETDFEGTGVFVGSRQAPKLIWNEI